MINKIDDICSKMEHSQPHTSFKCQRCAHNHMGKEGLEELNRKIREKQNV